MVCFVGLQIIILLSARGRQNCLKISISKYGHVICLFIGLWYRWTHFWHLYGYYAEVGRPSTIWGHQTCLKISISKYSHLIWLFIGFLGRWTHFWHLCGYESAVGRPSTLGGRQITCGRRAEDVPTLIFREINMKKRTNVDN